MGNRVPSKTTHLPLETFKKNLKLERNLLTKLLNHRHLLFLLIQDFKKKTKN